MRSLRHYPFLSATIALVVFWGLHSARTIDNILSSYYPVKGAKSLSPPYLQNNQTLPPLFFVHSGDSERHFPDYLADTVRQALRWNPRIIVHVIVPRSYLASSVGFKLLALGRSGFSESDDFWRDRVKICEVENVNVSTRLRNFRTTSLLMNAAEMGGFIRFTTERLFILEAAMKQLHVEEAFHMEIDNLLYVSLEEILVSLRQVYSGMAATALSHESMTAGFLYIHRISALERFLDYILGNHLSPSLPKNDMFYLSGFANMQPEELGMLPVAPVAANHEKSIRVQGNLNALAEIGGFFDNAAHGQWLGGAHDIHTGGKIIPHFSNHLSMFQASSLVYKWAVDPLHLLRRPYIRLCCSLDDDNWWPLYSVHVHSKQIFLFAS